MSLFNRRRNNTSRANRTPTRTRYPSFELGLTSLEDRAVPSFGWAAGVGGDTGNAVATDAAGNVYMAGTFSTTFTPAGSSLPLNSAGGSDIFVAKYSRSGAFQWATSIGGAQSDGGGGIAVDGTGTHLYVVGQFNGAYVADLDGATGSIRWGHTISGDSAVAVAVDGTSNAYVVSNDPGGITTREGGAYVTKLNANGAQQWQDTITATGTGAKPRVRGVAVSGSNVFVSGIFTNNASFAIGSHTYTVTSKSAWQGFILKIGAANSYAWSKTFQAVGSGGFVLSNRITADNTGNVYAYGQFMGKVDFTGAGKVNSGWTLDGGLYANSNGPAYVAKLNAAGQVVWAKKFATPFGDSMISYDDYNQYATIAVDGAGAVYLTGSFSGTLSFSPAGGGNLTSAGGNDVFVEKLDTNGNFQWAIRSGGAGDDASAGICVDNFGDIYIAGTIAAGTTDFDPANTYGDNRDLVTTAVATGFLWQITQP